MLYHMKNFPEVYYFCCTIILSNQEKPVVHKSINLERIIHNFQKICGAPYPFILLNLYFYYHL